MNTISRITTCGYLKAENIDYTTESPMNINYTYDNHSPAVDSLRKLTTTKIENNVEEYVHGKLSFEVIKEEITKESINHYLAAAKIADLLYPQSKMHETTFKIRLECLYTDKEINNGTNATGINLVNAFAMPPEHISDELYLNGINPRNSLLNQLSSADSAKKRSEIILYSQNEVFIHPEMAIRIENIVETFYKSVVAFSSELINNTTTIIRGSYGTGKTYSVKQYKLPSDKIMDLTDKLYSTDRLMNAFIDDFKCTPDQSFLMGLSVRKELDINIKKYNPTMPFFQEANIKTENDIDFLFVEGRPLHMKDMDGDSRLLELRVLNRKTLGTGANHSLLALSVIERGICEHRETRQYLVNKLRDGDSYQLQFSHNDGRIEILQKNEIHLVNRDQQEVENAKKTPITNDDLNVVGDGLKPFLGMTIEEAYKIANTK